MEYKMAFLLMLVMLTSWVAALQDMSGKMFTFPIASNRAYVKLITGTQEFKAVTICHRSFTDLRRDHALFSMATPSHYNSFLLFWDNTNKELEPHVMDKKAEYAGLDYKMNMWHSICTTWDSTSGIVQIWFNGWPSIRKYSVTGQIQSSSFVIILGQEQDSHGGGFDQSQSFVGMMTDVHMWNYVLSGCEIRNYSDERNFTPGNVISWKALEFEIVDKVLIEDRVTQCY
uniref:Pentraxin family member n=1 Tax=Cynoglossus semilaevis TaxID=244447 RepID=A0A3P8VJ01_CYNSE